MKYKQATDQRGNGEAREKGRSKRQEKSQAPSIWWIPCDDAGKDLHRMCPKVQKDEDNQIQGKN